MEAHVFLADAAQVDNKGKLHALGLGWTTVGTPLPPMAVVVLIQVPWNKTNQKHNLSVELLDADGTPAVVPGPAGDQSLKVDGEFEAGRPAGITPGSDINLPMSFNISAGLALAPGSYVWSLSINGHHEDAWSARFTVQQRAQKSQQ